MIGTKRRFTAQRHFPPLNSLYSIVAAVPWVSSCIATFKSTEPDVRATGCCCAAEIGVVLF
jgi:hypothetical protein